uniref:3'(2'),5'-bisphosphate nucleotidase 1 n=1 Tax=Lygus hesperus TaxID=30085 RepID=A0A0A9XDR7_LYGHE
MASTAPVLLRLLATSYSASAKAGQIVRDVMAKGDMGIIDKGKDDLQTLADTSAQRCIIAALSNSYPKATIIGEEGQSNIDDVPQDWIDVSPNEEILRQNCPKELASIREEDVTIWVDPLDGTKEYTEGLVDHVTVLIGMAVGDRPIGGIIHQPFFNNDGEKGRTIWGMKGVGMGGFTVAPPDPAKFIVTTSRSHSNTKVENALKILKADEVIRVGGAGYKVLLLLEGRAHAYVFPTPGCKRWDTCAPEALLNAVGGILSDTHGALYSYDKNIKDVVNAEGVLAAYNTEYHKRCVDALKE